MSIPCDLWKKISIIASYCPLHFMHGHRCIIGNHCHCVFWQYLISNICIPLSALGFSCHLGPKESAFLNLTNCSQFRPSEYPSAKILQPIGSTKALLQESHSSCTIILPISSLIEFTKAKAMDRQCIASWPTFYFYYKTPL